MVLENERQQREQDRADTETRELREKVDTLHRELHRLHQLVEFEFMAARVCDGGGLWSRLSVYIYLWEMGYVTGACGLLYRPSEYMGDGVWP